MKKEKDSMSLTGSTEENLTDIAEEQPAEAAGEETASVAEEQPADVVEEQSADTAGEETASVAEEQPADAAGEETASVAEEHPADAAGSRRNTGLGLYLQLCLPVLAFPILYFPYTMWWRRGFAAFAVQLAHESGSQFLRLMITGNNTILLFWCAVTVAVMLSAIVMSIIRMRPWYFIPVYIAVMFSLCGILSLFFYTMIIH